VSLGNLWWRPKIPMSKLSAPSPGQLEICLDLIRQHPAAGPKESGEPFSAHLLRQDQYQSIYIDFVNRDALPIGTIYKSWAVVFQIDGSTQVFYGRSRRGANGDSTLPPEGPE